ncbi:MAG: NAD(P)(+) transhydrogenase (Re/Si-specific) subunit beta [Acidobacteria bacterium]|nr:NAD(P)(+) transhydrogenase (Re/Si-specific) subunit beta [Acidobacteriota bacterium]MBI3426195.1 NAD(P)(+) transhydrogenase (Re/Si-specific) subunit beta [Acidobacteriota bacterium]
MQERYFYFIEFSYLIASLLFIYGLKALSHPKTARRGMNSAAAGMLLAIIGTLLNYKIIDYTWIWIGLLIGGLIGAAMSIWMPMTAMPQRTALSHAFGALAASLVGISEYYHHTVVLHEHLPMYKMAALGFEVLFGSLTVTGSLLAFAKLQELMRGTPITYKGQNVVNVSLFIIAALIFVYLIFNPLASTLFYVMVGLSFLFGVLLVIPIGSADMPVVMSLMNSYAGLASAATGFALGNNVLIIAGTLDGFSGFILSILMCKAMNRPITNVLFGAFGAVSQDTGPGVEGVMREVSAEDVAVQLAYARQVVFVPGYGMATAQAQHAVRELAEVLQHKGVQVKYAIHPVAGRMPGHMNVLLAEANVPYSQLYELEQINPEMQATDVCVVIGANDVVNPDARDNPKSAIAGMPIIEVDKSQNVVVLKRGKGRGFSGLENPLFFKPNTGMLYGDAKASLTKLAQEVTQA